MMDDLDAVPVRIAEVTGARAIAMGTGSGIDRDAAALEKSRPSIDILRFPYDETQMIERRSCRGRCRGR